MCSRLLDSAYFFVPNPKFLSTFKGFPSSDILFPHFPHVKTFTKIKVHVFSYLRSLAKKKMLPETHVFVVVVFLPNIKAGHYQFVCWQYYNGVSLVGRLCHLTNQPATVISYIVFCMSCLWCHSLSLPHGAVWVDLYIVCSCCISWLYSLFLALQDSLFPYSHDKSVWEKANRISHISCK